MNTWHHTSASAESSSTNSPRPYRASFAGSSCGHTRISSRRQVVVSVNGVTISLQTWKWGFPEFRAEVWIDERTTIVEKSSFSKFLNNCGSRWQRSHRRLLVGLRCAKLLPEAKWTLIWPEILFCDEFLLVISLFACFLPCSTTASHSKTVS